MRSGAVALGAAVLVGLAAVLLVAARDERDLAFTLGVRPVKVVARLAPGAVACQTPVYVEYPFRGVAFDVGPSRAPVAAGPRQTGGAPVDVTVRRGAVVVSHGALERGYATPSVQQVRLDETVPAERGDVAICLRNRGARRVALRGDIAGGLGQGELRVDGRARDADLRLVLLRERPRSALALVPEMFRRAALFRPTWVGAWTFWLLLVAVVLGVPLLLARALGAAVAASHPDGDADSRAASAERSARST